LKREEPSLPSKKELGGDFKEEETKEKKRWI
jgi:hypothetical protein